MSQDDRIDVDARAESVADAASSRRWMPRPGPLGIAVDAAAWLGAGLAATFEREMEAGRGFLWLPVAFAVGILTYFTLPQEPWLPATAAAAAVLAFAAWRMRADAGACRLLVVLAAVAAGLLAAKVRTDQVTAPVLAREMTVTVTGWITEREEAARGAVRIRLSVHDVDEIYAGPTPTTVRVTVRTGADGLAVGDPVSVLARLRPPGGPVIPGGYDFSRAAFYEGIGAIGFAYGAASEALALGPPPPSVRLWKPLELLRDSIRRRIEVALPGDAGHVAAALVIGDKGGIAESTEEDMRASGLAHILAISGLHMALVGAGPA